jgi:hypothetical protein
MEALCNRLWLVSDPKTKALTTSHWFLSSTLRRFRHKLDALTISASDTSLETLSMKINRTSPKALRKHRASNGKLNARALVKQESVAGQLMFIVRLVGISKLSRI